MWVTPLRAWTAPVPVIQDEELLPLLREGAACAAREYQPWLRCYKYLQEDMTVYLLVNSSMNHRLDTAILVEEAPAYVWYHAEDNTLEAAQPDQRGWLPLSLDRGESVILLAGRQEALPGEGDLPFRPALSGERRELSGAWSISLADYREQERFQPLCVTDQLEDISSKKPGFSGIICYETAFEGPARIIDLGRAFEGVEVLVNGRSAGVRVGYPYRYDVSALAGEGENQLTVLAATSLGDALGDDLSKQRPFSPEGILGPVMLLN